MGHKGRMSNKGQLLCAEILGIFGMPLYTVRESPLDIGGKRKRGGKSRLSNHSNWIREGQLSFDFAAGFRSCVSR